MYTNEYCIKWSQGLPHWGSEDSILAMGQHLCYYAMTWDCTLKTIALEN